MYRPSACRRSLPLSSIDLVDYWSNEPNVAVLHLPAGRYSLTAIFHGLDPAKNFVPAGQPPMHPFPYTFWTGDLYSNAIDVTFRSPV